MDSLIIPLAILIWIASGITPAYIFYKWEKKETGDDDFVILGLGAVFGPFTLVLFALMAIVLVCGWLLRRLLP